MKADPRQMKEIGQTTRAGVWRVLLPYVLSLLVWNDLDQGFVAVLGKERRYLVLVTEFVHAHPRDPDVIAAKVAAGAQGKEAIRVARSLTCDSVALKTLRENKADIAAALGDDWPAFEAAVGAVEFDVALDRIVALFDGN